MSKLIGVVWVALVFAAGCSEDRKPENKPAATGNGLRAQLSCGPLENKDSGGLTTLAQLVDGQDGNYRLVNLTSYQYFSERDLTRGSFKINTQISSSAEPGGPLPFKQSQVCSDLSQLQGGYISQALQIPWIVSRKEGQVFRDIRTETRMFGPGSTRIARSDASEQAPAMDTVQKYFDALTAAGLRPEFRQITPDSFSIFWSVNESPTEGSGRYVSEVFAIYEFVNK